MVWAIEINTSKYGWRHWSRIEAETVEEAEALSRENLSINPAKLRVRLLDKEETAKYLEHKRNKASRPTNLERKCQLGTGRTYWVIESRVNDRWFTPQIGYHSSQVAAPNIRAAIDFMSTRCHGGGVDNIRLRPPTPDEAAILNSTFTSRTE